MQSTLWPHPNGEIMSKLPHVALAQAQTHASTINASAHGIVYTHRDTQTQTHTHTQQSINIDTHLEIHPAHALKRSLRVRCVELPCVVVLDRRCQT